MRSFVLPSLLFVLIAFTSCQRQQLSNWSHEAKGTIVSDIAGSESGGLSPRERDYVMEELERYVADRQRRDLERENDRLRDELRNRGGGMFPVVGVSATSIERRLARTYGISTAAVRKLASLLGQAGMGDARGLHGLGLDERALEAAARNGGRLSQEQLAYTSRRLGVSPRKLDQLMQRLVSR